eukprot:jgi/Undpi1/8483/HiC_scaffold_25.g10950.m1
MFDWATGGLVRTCEYLQFLFGKGSCRVDFSRREERESQARSRFADRTMIFDPSLGGSDARCSCETIESVTILLSRVDKHTLPVSTDCAYSHNHGIELAPDPNNKHSHGHSACKFADGAPLTNHVDVWRCVHEANCNTTDDWLQMVVFRDPRPAVLPFDVVEATAQAAADDNLGFGHKKIDAHPGEEARRAESKVRRFEDEVDPEVLEIADAVLRVWLPPVLLDKLRVSP